MILIVVFDRIGAALEALCVLCNRNHLKIQLEIINFHEVFPVICLGVGDLFANFFIPLSAGITPHTFVEFYVPRIPDFKQFCAV